MKKLFVFTIIAFATLQINAQKLEQIFSLEECGVASLLDNTAKFAVIENIADAPNLAIYNARKKALVKSYKSRLPENPIVHILPLNNDSLYFITIKKNSETGMPLFDAIYLFDLQKDSLQLLYTEKEKKFTPFTASIISNKIVLSSKPVKVQPFVFDLRKLEYEPFSNDSNLRMIFADNFKNKYIVANVNEVTSEDSIPIYVMGTNGSISEKVGKYCATLSFSSDSEDYIQPGITVTNPDYDWIVDGYERSGMPLSGFQIATRPGIAKTFNKLANVAEVTGILSNNNAYLIAEGQGGKVFVYKTKKGKKHKK